MSEHRARIEWQRSSPDFTYATYNRAHDWQFTATKVPASATKEYRGDANRVNPEEALVAALLAKMHHDVHEGCFIANSVKTEVSVAAQG